MSSYRFSNYIQGENLFISNFQWKYPSVCSDGIPIGFLHCLVNACHCLGNSGSICIGHIRLFSSTNGHGKVGISFAIFPQNHLRTSPSQFPRNPSHPQLAQIIPSFRVVRMKSSTFIRACLHRVNLFSHGYELISNLCKLVVNTE